MKKKKNDFGYLVSVFLIILAVISVLFYSIGYAVAEEKGKSNLIWYENYLKTFDADSCYYYNTHADYEFTLMGGEISVYQNNTELDSMFCYWNDFNAKRITNCYMRLKK